MKRRTALLALALVPLGIAGAAAWYLWPASSPPPVWANDYDTTAHPPENIPPGTVVGTSAPDGWSHLVIKSLPRVKPGEEKNIPLFARSRTVRMIPWMFTAFLADVRPETLGGETRHHLRTVALGFGTTVGGRDVVITPETAAAHGVELDWITRTILTKGYETQKLAMVVARGPAFALVDTPVWYRCGEKNRLIRFRYALLVDPVTGRLDTLLWTLDPEGRCGEPDFVLLNPDQINEAELIPVADGFNALGIASDSAFGVDHLPPHRVRVPVPADLRAVAAKSKYAPDEARRLEAALRQLLAPNR